MGLCNGPNIFQEKMNELFNGLEYVSTYINDLSVISNKSFEDHINKLDKVVSKLKQKSKRVNADKSFFPRSKLEYLEFRITKQGIMPLPDNVEAIKDIAVPTTKK